MAPGAPFRRRPSLPRFVGTRVAIHRPRPQETRLLRCAQIGVGAMNLAPSGEIMRSWNGRFFYQPSSSRPGGRGANVE